MRPACLGLALAIVSCAGAAAGTEIRPRILIVGDSIQTGQNLRDASAQAAAVLQRLGNVIVQDFSRPGARLTTFGFVPGMEEAGPAINLLHGPFGRLDGVVINLGTNDWALGGDPADFERAYTRLLAALPPGMRAVCMGITWSDLEGRPNARGYTKDDFRAATRRACDVRGIPYLDGRDAIPNDRTHFPDGQHPGDAGHRAMGRWLAKQLAARGWLQ